MHGATTLVVVVVVVVVVVESTLEPIEPGFAKSHTYAVTEEELRFKFVCYNAEMAMETARTNRGPTKKEQAEIKKKSKNCRRKREEETRSFRSRSSQQR